MAFWRIEDQEAIRTINVRNALIVLPLVVYSGVSHTLAGTRVAASQNGVDSCVRDDILLIEDILWE